MRALLLALVLVGLGCRYPAEEAALDDDIVDDGASAGECATATDCVLAATSCCGCDDYAVPAGEQRDDCDVVECPDPAPPDCAAIVPACVDGVCTITCAPMECDLACPAGFATDAAGCLVCACATPECEVDDECVRVAGDCCGCERGGSDTAVAARDADAFRESLMCPSDPACPDVDVCDPSLVARCVGGQCVLDNGAAPSGEQPCGSPDLPPCPEGTVCVLNAEDDSSDDGLGVCRPG